MRQVLFDEFQRNEWQARVEAIRERSDEQRLQRQEQEREQEQEADRLAQADRQAAQVQRQRARMSSSLQWNGDRLLPGEHCESHLLEFRNIMGTGAYRYASGYADIALRKFNAVDERPGLRATKLLMLSLDRDLAADLQGKNGAAANEDSQLQVQRYGTPDDAPVVFARFADATLLQLEDMLQRMSTC